MTTRKQRAANRRNAKKSTGPKTPEGKAKSAQNATKHGLLSGRPLLADEDPAAYEEHRLTLLHELWPETPLEQGIVERIAASQWRLLSLLFQLPTRQTRHERATNAPNAPCSR